MNDSSNNLEKDIDKLIATLKDHSSQASSEPNQVEYTPPQKVVIPQGFHEVTSFASNKISTAPKKQSNSSSSSYSNDAFSRPKNLEGDIDGLISSLKGHVERSSVVTYSDSDREEDRIRNNYSYSSNLESNKNAKPNEIVVKPKVKEYKESNAIKIIGKSIDMVSSVKESVNNIVDRAKTKSLVRDLETAARAKIAIEELTDSRKPLKIESSSTLSLADEIRKLASLRDEGIISEREFQDLKDKLINR